MIRLFYESDNISRAMPSKIRYVSREESNVLCNLMEGYRLLKHKFFNMKVNCTKSIKLRPSNAKVGFNNKWKS